MKGAKKDPSAEQKGGAISRMFNLAKHKKDHADESLYAKELGDKRLVRLKEIMSIYKELDIRIKPFEIVDEVVSSLSMPPHPCVNLPYEVDELELLPSIVA